MFNKVVIFILLWIFPTVLLAQIKAVKYSLIYNEVDSVYDCYVHVDEGVAVSPIHRTQFNAQFSVIVPTGVKVSISQNYMPIQNNQLYKGDIPLQWQITSTLKNPKCLDGHDIIGITPQLAPASQYHDLHPNDKIKIFSLNIEPKPLIKTDVYLFDNKKDPTSSAPGMQGASFVNGFTIGGVKDVYVGNK